MIMDKELLFAKKLDEARSLAREQGNTIESAQIAEAFSELMLDATQLQMVHEYLKKHNIGIDEEPDFDGALSAKEKNYLEHYLKDIAALPVYTQGEKEALIISAMAGESDAIRKVTEMYLRDVVDIAKLYAGQGVFLEDLIGEGNLALSFGVGMLGSLEKPQEAQGMLGKMIMDAMEEHIAETVQNRKADKKAEDHVNKVADAAKALSEELRRKVTVAELAKESGMSENRIREAMRISGFQIEDIEDLADE